MLVVLNMGYDRGSGRTAAQLRMTPRGADYVVPFYSHIGYCKYLASDMGILLPDDINFITISMFTEDRYRGKRNPIVMIDHSVCQFFRAKVILEKRYREMIDYIEICQGTIITV